MFHARGCTIVILVTGIASKPHNKKSGKCHIERVLQENHTRGGEDFDVAHCNMGVYKQTKIQKKTSVQIVKCYKHYIYLLSIKNYFKTYSNVFLGQKHK
ncbi:unnamed protein product [Trifolium pratense]|uniref:Uncharacterized protein n=1 Tax=Trifolium pratense TaxID=57577 RepID=A0ACB0I8F5_TRIPR|nr:unnamed protein product [Trifolium pratense]